MSCIQPEAILRVAESLAVPKVSTDAAKALAPHIDVRLREIIQDACKFARHSKRAKLTNDDINSALCLCNCESVYGFGGRDPARFVKASGHPDLYYLDDPEEDVEKIIEAPLPKPPLQVGVVPHWLAIDGVQPRIAENEVPEKTKTKRSRAQGPKSRNVKAKLAPAEGEGRKTQETQEAVAVIPPIKQVLSAELQVYLDKLKACLEDAKLDTSGRFEGLQALPDSSEGAVAERQASHTGTTTSTQAGQQNAIFASLASDPGLHPLAPALVDLITNQVKTKLKNIPCLHLVIKIAKAMLQNEDIHIELYLHKLISPLLTCLVTKKLGVNHHEDHWSLRRSAAGVIATICQTYGSKYPNLPQRISKQLVTALTDPSRPLTTHFGAVIGLSELGQRVAKTLLLPHAESCFKRLQPMLDQDKDLQAQSEAFILYKALQQACASCLYASLSDAFSKEFLCELPQNPAKQRGLVDGKIASGLPQKKPVAKRKGRGKAKAPARTKSRTTADPPPLAEAPSQEVKEGEEGILKNAWREEANTGAMLESIEDIFGDSIQPYVPWPTLDQLA